MMRTQRKVVVLILTLLVMGAAANAQNYSAQNYYLENNMGSLSAQDWWLDLEGGWSTGGIVLDPTLNSGDVVVLQNEGFPFRVVDTDPSGTWGWDESNGGYSNSSLTNGTPTNPDNNIFCVSTWNDFTGVGSPNACSPFDIFDVSNRETFGDGYMHWYANGVGESFDSSGYPIGSVNPGWNAGISNTGTGMLSFDTTVNGNGHASITAGTLTLTQATQANGGSITFPNGTIQSTAWNGIVSGDDYAEAVDVSGDRTHYEPGDVITIDPNSPGKFQKSAEAYSTLVAGIYSTKPGVLGKRSLDDNSPTEIPMAIVGMVPTKVTAENGPIHRGDLLVASHTPGRAMKGTDRSLLTGAVIGKALGELDSGTGVIEVLISLQ